MRCFAAFAIADLRAGVCDKADAVVADGVDADKDALL
jgi:hypothetical protein